MNLDVRLREEDHVYLDSKNRTYMSGTTIVGNYKEKFDPYKIIRGETLIAGYVRKNGGTEAYWLAEWERKKNAACFDGTMFHKIKEDGHNYAKFLDHNFTVSPIRSFDRETKANPSIGYNELPDGAYMELTLFNRRFMIAGQADKVVKDGNYVDIDDYKTNATFNKTSFFNPKTKQYKMMLYPAHALQDCHLGHYTLQLNIYAWMLSQSGLTPRNLRLLYYHISEEERVAMRNGRDMSYLQPEIITVPVDLKLAEAVIRNNNVAHRGSTNNSMYLV